MLSEPETGTAEPGTAGSVWPFKTPTTVAFCCPDEMSEQLNPVDAKGKWKIRSGTPSPLTSVMLGLRSKLSDWPPVRPNLTDATSIVRGSNSLRVLVTGSKTSPLSTATGRPDVLPQFQLLGNPLGLTSTPTRIVLPETVSVAFGELTDPVQTLKTGGVGSRSRM